CYRVREAIFMADKSNPSDPAKPGGRQARRPRTIDLQATDMTPPPESVSANTSSNTSNTNTSGRTARDSTSRNGASLPPSSGGVKQMLGSAAVGAFAMLFVVVFLWGSGFIGNPGYSGRTSANEPSLRETIGRSPPPVRNGEPRNLDELATRVDRLEKGTQSHPPANDSALASRLASAENASKTFADDIGGRRPPIGEMTAPTPELRTGVDAATPIDKNDFDAMSNRIAALEKSAGAMENEIGKRATVTSDRAVRLALATSALRAAVERGEPFGSELAAAKPLAAEN